MSNKLGFTFAGRTIDYFGSKAITSDITALFELIKNSRDANASEVIIHFKYLKGKTSIKVSDNGDGMSENDIKNKWMVIGTNSRLDNDRTKTGKPVWGEMGIGRMACQKLGSLVDLTTIHNNQEIKMFFDWSLFEKPDITVDKISFPFEMNRFENMKNGTILEINCLKSKWTNENINYLKKEIGILITEENFDDLEITIRVEDDDGDTIKKDNTKHMKDVTDNAPFKLKGEFDENGLNVSLFTQVEQRGKWEKKDTTITYEDYSTGPFTVEIFHFPRAPGKISSHPIEKYYKNRIGVDNLENFLDDNYGMYLYRDGAWMKPYGREMDWLSLEAAARQETSKIGLKQVFGRVNLSKEKNPEIKPASHRETLIENKAYDDLKNIMNGIFLILRDHMNEWKKIKKKERPVKPKPRPLGDDDPSDPLESILDNIKKSTQILPMGEQRSIKLGLDEIRNIVNDDEQERKENILEIGEIRNYEKNLATLGIATSFMARQVTGPLEENMRIVSEGEEMRKKIETQDWKLSDDEIVRTATMLKDMKHNQYQILHFMKFVNVLAEHIAQSINNNKKYTQVNVFECWQNVSNGFQDKSDDLKIKIINNSKNPHTQISQQKLTVKIDMIDLECILTNLYLNSIYSLEKTKDGKRKVEFHYWHQDKKLFIEFRDNGRGIPTTKLEEVFEPFKFGHSQDKRQMHGHGLGLYIVKKIMDNYDGTAKAVNMTKGAKIRLEFHNIIKVAG